jgi:MFS family permease
MTPLNTDIILLFITRILRMFSYGLLSIALVLYLVQLGLSETETGFLLTLTLIGDAVISLGITTTADRLGRRRMLILGAILMTVAGVTFVLTRNLTLLTIAAIIGIISPSGYEIGPFLAIEQAALSQLISNEQRTRIFAWYNLVGVVATALGTLLGGLIAQTLQNQGVIELDSYRVLLIGYALSGLLLAVIFTQLSPTIETTPTTVLPTTSSLGLSRSRGVVMKLSILFALDAFAGGFIIQSLMVYWFHLKFGANIGLLGSIFFGANILAGISALLAARLAAHIGLINTMVFTHIPSNILLVLIPFMPNLPLAVGLLLLRFSISQMDVPTRQSYTMAIISPEERSAAGGVLQMARSVGASLSPALSGLLLANPVLFNVPLFLAGGLKIVYDLLLYHSFKTIKPPEERTH